MATFKRFDPEAHLHKQGWKGKGTALKEGHATRPLAVVRKKNLAGIGKDRDEAIPFWDNIFAATAASIISSTNPSNKSSPATTPGASTPVVTVEQTLTKQTLSVAARVGREVARRGLYSRFFRGTPVSPAEEDIEIDLPVEPTGGNQSEASSSRSVAEPVVDDVRKAKSKGKGKEGEKETKEEKAARRAARSLRNAEKAERRQAKLERKAARAELGAGNIDANIDTTKKRKRSSCDSEATKTAEDLGREAETAAADRVKRKQEKKAKKETEERKERKERKEGRDKKAKRD